MSVRMLLLSSGLLLFASVASSTTILVPADQPTIQAGIDAAITNDTILVAPGTYTGSGNRQIVFGGKNVVLRSSAGSESTLIDCEGSALDPQIAFLIDGQQDSTNIIEGFTITGCFSSTSGQGAITVNNATLHLRGCRLDSNTGQAIFIGGNSPGEDFLILEDCRITNTTGGPAVYGHYFSVHISGTELGFNSGGGLIFWQCHELVVDNSIFHNNDGTGLLFSQMGSNCQITNCTFVLNRTGIVFDWDFPKSSEDGIYYKYLDSSGMANCIVAFNEEYGVLLASPFEYYMNCNDVYGNLLGDWTGGEPYTATGNISYDPRFCDTATADFTLQSGSACLPTHNGCGVLMGALDEGCVGPPPPAVRLVPSEYSTIQAAIDACNIDDTVLVSAGTYSGEGNRDLDFNGISLILMSESGPEGTIIDCGGTVADPHRGLHLHSGEAITTIVQGFTFTNAYQSGWHDAAVVLDGANAVIRGCVFENNSANGLTAGAAEVVISNCVSRNNLWHGFEINGPIADVSHVEAYSNGDNGIFIDGGGEFVVDSSLMYENTGSGMFIHYFSGSFYVSNCTFVANQHGLRYDWNFPKSALREGDLLLPDTAYIDNCIAAFNTDYGFTSAHMVIPHLARCSDAFGNGAANWNVEYYDGLVYGDWDVYGNFSMDPHFCDTSLSDYTINESSPCSPGISFCGLVGALDVGCQNSHDPRTWHVPGERPTIQEAINSSLEGDTVLVAPGIYTGPGNVDLRFLGRNIVLRSESGPYSTTIDCQGTPGNPHSGIKITSGEDTTSVIEGFGIANSFGYSGAEGAITIRDASATVRNCVISYSYGNSLLCENGSLNFYDCVVDSCTTNGVKLVSCNAKIDGMTGTRLSHAVFWGGSSEWLELSNSVMYNNRGFGVSVFPITGTFNITSCTFVDNLTGIYLSQNDKSVSAATDANDTSFIRDCISAYHEQYGFYTWEGMNHPVVVMCNDAFGNGFQDWRLAPFGHGDVYGNLALDPLFCNPPANNFNLQSNSPCAPENNGCGVLMGARDVGCQCCLGSTGNVTGDPAELVNLSDLTKLVNYLFVTFEPPPCRAEANTNGDPACAINLTDITNLVNYLFVTFKPVAACGDFPESACE